jgi:hypothetical protein
LLFVWYQALTDSKKKRRRKDQFAGFTMASSSLGYVAVPRCPLTFDGINYADFAAHMRVHMRVLWL